MVKTIFVDCYLAHNLGDDLFLYTLLARYPETHFVIIADNSYSDLVDQFGNVDIFVVDMPLCLGTIVVFADNLRAGVRFQNIVFSWASLVLIVAAFILSLVFIAARKIRRKDQNETRISY